MFFLGGLSRSAGSQSRGGRSVNRLGRHCGERSDEAIHASASGETDCFAALAMTLREFTPADEN